MKHQTYFFLSVILFLAVSYASAQEVYTTATGTMHFISKAAVGDIEATSNLVKAAYFPSEKKIEIEVPIRSFIFNKALMQEYFNEKYMESARFPKAWFEGILDQPIDFSRTGSFPVVITGKLTIHGISKKRSIKGIVTIINKKASITSDFTIAGTDHSIKSPDKIYESVGEQVEVSFKAVLAAALKSGKNNQ